jgi:hypothetical protein
MFERLACSELRALGSLIGRTDGSIVLSFDLDFGDILALGVMDKPSAIIFRRADVQCRPGRRAPHHLLGQASGGARLDRTPHE